MFGGDWAFGPEWLCVGGALLALACFLGSRLVDGGGRVALQCIALLALAPVAITAAVWVALPILVVVIVGGYAVAALPADVFGAIVFVMLLSVIGLMLRELFKKGPRG